MSDDNTCNPHSHDAGGTSTALCSSHHFYAISEDAEQCQMCGWKRTRVHHTTRTTTLTRLRFIS